MFETHTMIANSILAITNLALVCIAYKAIAKASKKNLISIVTTIVDDKQRELNFWYFIIEILDCYETFKLRLTINEQFTYLKHWLSAGQFSVEQNTQRCLDIRNMTGNDKIIICYRIDPSNSQYYLSFLKKDKNISKIINYKTDSVRLKLINQGYSQFPLDVKDQFNKSN